MASLWLLCVAVRGCVVLWLLCVSLRLRQAAPVRLTPPPPSEQEEFPLYCCEALGQVKDGVAFVAGPLEHLMECPEKRCNYAALR